MIFALVAYLLRKKVKHALSVRPSPRRALAWLISAHQVSRWKASRLLTPRGRRCRCQARRVALTGLLLGMKAPGAQMIASVTFIAILTTILIQAPTTRWLGKGLGLLETNAR
jgi:NhaP-type Na+/H+ or K+/H+ antiporter